VVHGHQQLSLFNAHYDERCFLPIHVYDADSGHCVAVLLRPGKTPSGKEIRGHLRRLIRRIRLHWPQTRITIRGDSHYGRPEVMDWCDANDVGFILGLSGNSVLASLVDNMSLPTARARIWRGMTEPRALERTLAEHRAIHSAILSGDADLARSWATVHIGGIESWLRTTLRD